MGAPQVWLHIRTSSLSIILMKYALLIFSSVPSPWLVCEDSYICLLFLCSPQPLTCNLSKVLLLPCYSCAYVNYVLTALAVPCLVLFLLYIYFTLIELPASSPLQNLFILIILFAFLSLGASCSVLPLSLCLYCGRILSCIWGKLNS